MGQSLGKRVCGKAVSVCLSITGDQPYLDEALGGLFLLRSPFLGQQKQLSLSSSSLASSLYTFYTDKYLLANKNISLGSLKNVLVSHFMSLCIYFFIRSLYNFKSFIQDKVLGVLGLSCQREEHVLRWCGSGPYTQLISESRVLCYDGDGFHCPTPLVSSHNLWTFEGECQ